MHVQHTHNAQGIIYFGVPCTQHACTCIKILCDHVCICVSLYEGLPGKAARIEDVCLGMYILECTHAEKCFDTFITAKEVYVCQCACICMYSK